MVRAAAALVLLAVLLARPLTVAACKCNGTPGKGCGEDIMFPREWCAVDKGSGCDDEETGSTSSGESYQWSYAACGACSLGRWARSGRRVVFP